MGVDIVGDDLIPLYLGYLPDMVPQAGRTMSLEDACLNLCSQEARCIEISMQGGQYPDLSSCKTITARTEDGAFRRTLTKTNTEMLRTYVKPW